MARLERLRRDHPEWGPWLGPLAVTLREATDPVWEAGIPLPPAAEEGRPRLAGATLHLDPVHVRRWFATLARSAPATRRARIAEPFAVLEAAVAQESERLSVLATAAGVPAAPFRCLADLAAVPLLQACGRLWKEHVPATWTAGFCPICGAWPTLAEARGVERARRLRCGRCGGDWPTEWLRCPYCETREHTRLGALVSEPTAERRRVETCRACGGYLKTLTTLLGSDGAAVLIDDAATVDLDVGAQTAGYCRPARPALELTVRILPRRSAERGLLSWPA
jgi:FdhE protein